MSGCACGQAQVAVAPAFGLWLGGASEGEQGLGHAIWVDDLMQVGAGKGAHRPAALPCLACLGVVGRAEEQICAAVVLPPVRDGHLLLVVGQRQPGLLAGDRLAGRRVGNIGATSGSSHQSVHRGSRPSAPARPRRNGRNSPPTMGVCPRGEGTDASTKIEHVTGRARLRRITGMNTPALLWATRISGSPAFVPASRSPTALQTRCQNGGPPSPTASRDGTIAGQPPSVSLSATADQVAGPTDGLCTRTNNGMLPLFHRAPAANPSSTGSEHN